MNRMYRWQRFIYDATRRYYLLGRDQLIAELKPAPGAHVLEIGCGTGRNLIQSAKRYPSARFFGIDVSTEMLTTALAAIKRHRLDSSIRVAHGDATDFDPAKIFTIDAPDHIVISYALSMIPDWKGVLNEAVTRLKPGGQLHIVDFGNQERLPASARRLLLHWLTLFDVTPRRELQDALVTLAERHQAQLTFKRPFRGYAQSAVLTLKK
ncbi:class I SAM-dependent methyltransferase [Tardiphaga alba]|uniref:Class I SAM-dependent methyltransferase n=2 Tax=Tardiphaga alba TaxID=340268 RepID=A0ABX8AEX0_9BRAD|nr:class I SAM-dependent methyltransferase [Tardiphaga alba]QUS42282.1 class I SAM-dependent methyltransferase [Tardiphaga alba]